MDAEREGYLRRQRKDPWEEESDEPNSMPRLATNKGNERSVNDERRAGKTGGSYRGDVLGARTGGATPESLPLSGPPSKLSLPFPFPYQRRVCPTEGV